MMAVKSHKTKIKKEKPTMKTKILTSIGCLLLMAAFVRADAILNFNDNGQGGLTATSGAYTPGSTFTFDITLSVTSGGSDPITNVNAISYWFQTSGMNTGYFTITNRQFTAGPNTSPWQDPQTPGITYPQHIQPGGNENDLGGTGNTQPSDATYFVARITLQIDPSTPVGTYTISTTTIANGGPRSVVGGTDNVAHELPATTYTITVVPEPATLSLLGLSGLGSFGLTVLRRRRG